MPHKPSLSRNDCLEGFARYGVTSENYLRSSTTAAVLRAKVSHGERTLRPGRGFAGCNRIASVVRKANRAGYASRCPSRESFHRFPFISGYGPAPQDESRAGLSTGRAEENHVWADVTAAPLGFQPFKAIAQRHVRPALFRAIRSRVSANSPRI